MSGLVTSAESAPVDISIDDLVDDVSASAGGRIFEFPGCEEPLGQTTLDPAVMRQLSDLLLLPSSMLHPQERAFAVDLIHSGLDAADVETRRDLAVRLARAGKVSPSIVARLAHDPDLQVAQPLLRHGANVADRDLVEVVRGGCPERTYQIASRARLAEDVAAVIAEIGPPAAVYALLRNAGATLTPATVECIARRALTDPSLTEPLLNRAEMTAACALELFWSVDRARRLYILRRFLAEAGTVRGILAGNAPVAPVDETGSDEAKRDRARQGSIIIALETMFRGRAEPAAANLSLLTGVSTATMRLVLHDEGGEAMAIAIKAAGGTRATFEAVLDAWLASDAPPVAPPVGTDELVDLFARLSRGHAAMAMTYWDWRMASRGPYAARAGTAPEAAPTRIDGVPGRI